MADNDLTNAQQNEIDSASKNAFRKDPAVDVRQWLQDVHAATLSTLSTKADISGFPACSVVPFALDANGAPFILIAEIAAHTRNLNADQRCSLFIRHDTVDGDPQSKWRATLIGRMEKCVVQTGDSGKPLQEHEVAISDDEFAALRARYRERVPASDGYLKTHDFNFWRMRKIKQVRYIAGFGRICWFDGDKLLSPPTDEELAQVAPGAIEHMNEDHRDAMELICQSLHGFEPKDIQMTELDRRGFFMSRSDEPTLLYTSFGTEITAGGLRKAMVDITRRARQIAPQP